MAADSLMMGFYTARSTPKILRYRDILIGMAGSTVADIWLADCDPVLRCESKLGELAADWRAWCKKRGHTEVSNGLTTYPASWLILGPTSIFDVDTNGEVFRHPAPHIAIGAGGLACMAAAHALRAVEPGNLFNVSHIAVAAVNAAISLVEGCGGAVQVQTLTEAARPGAVMDTPPALRDWGEPGVVLPMQPVPVVIPDDPFHIDKGYAWKPA